MLTYQRIRNAEPSGKGYKLHDALGLFLYVTAKGSRSWRFKYRYAGKERLLVFGLFPEVSLAEARDRRDAARRELRDGKDPWVEAKKRKYMKLQAGDNTLASLAQKWLSDHEGHWSPANAYRVRSRVENDILKSLGKLPVTEITSSMVLTQLRKIEARGAIETAKRVKGDVLAILTRARAERLISADIIEDVKGLAEALKPTPPARRLPALVDVGELLEFQKAVDRSPGHLLTKLASRFLALTLVRVGTLCLARWSEFEGIDWTDPAKPPERPVWKIPPAHMKLKTADKEMPEFRHDVPLSVEAVATLRMVRQLSGHAEFVFPRMAAWRKPMSVGALSGLYKTIAGGRYKDRMVPHGWRSAFSTLMNERAALLDRAGDRLIIDMILAHMPNGVSASEWAYNRARYSKPKAALLQAWSDMIFKDLQSPETLISSYR